VSERENDTQRVSSVVARRRLHRLFVQARKSAGFASRDLAAKALGWSPRKQALLESDEQAIPIKDLDVILTTFGVPEEDRPMWHELAEVARSRCWWDDYDDADLSAEGKRFVGLEWGARRIRTFDGSIMPALLQIPAYTVAALESGLVDRPREQVDRLLAVRRQRQRVLGNPDPLEYHAIVDEAALQRPAGDADIMTAQLLHIVDLVTTRPNLTVQVVPFSAGLYPGQSGTFEIMDFPPVNEEPALVHSEPGFDASLYIEDLDDVYLYSRVFRRLTEIALDPDASLRLLFDVATKF
jgi:hypothetical protein